MKTLLFRAHFWTTQDTAFYCWRIIATDIVVGGPTGIRGGAENIGYRNFIATQVKQRH